METRAELEARYFTRLAAAFVRGRLGAHEHHRREGADIFETDIQRLTEAQRESLFRLGLREKLSLHKFKRTMGLERVQKVLGILRGLQPTNLLDIGSGRGAFLWPCLEAFPDVPVTAVDQDERRVADLLAVRDGGLRTLDARRMDATSLGFQAGAFDVVSALEVLEHIPEPRRAISEILRVTRRAVVVSVPSHEDDNPGHIHRFTAKVLSQMLQTAGAVRVNVQYVLNHMILVASRAG